MLAIFKNGVVDPPQELNSPASVKAKPNHPGEVLKDFLSSHSDNCFSISFADNAMLACAPAPPQPPLDAPLRAFCGMSDIYCIFLGSLHNLCTLNKQYGLSKGANEAMFIIEAYRTLRDRGPYPAHQVLKDLEGSFGFIIYDNKAGNAFVALGSDETVKLFWGIAADGSVMISDNEHHIKAGCAKSFAPFPAGCMYHSERGLASFEYPMKTMKAMPRVDSEGAMCGANFKVDIYSKYSNGMSTSSSFSSGRGEEKLDLRYRPRNCFCGHPASIRVVEVEKPVKGRLHYACEARICDFWKWCEPVVATWAPSGALVAPPGVIEGTVSNRSTEKDMDGSQLSIMRETNPKAKSNGPNMTQMLVKCIFLSAIVYLVVILTMNECLYSFSEVQE